MPASRRVHMAVLAPGARSQQLILVLLAAALLWTSFAGRAGMQVLSEATAARLVSLHQHGIPGERAYVATHGQPAPFVPGHCHAPLSTPGAQPGPDDVMAASALSGSVLCAVAATAAAVPAAVLPVPPAETLSPEGRTLLPLILPPR